MAHLKIQEALTFSCLSNCLYTQTCLQLLQIVAFIFYNTVV